MRPRDWARRIFPAAAVAAVAVVAAALPLKPAAADGWRYDDRNWKGGYHRP
jgi:hypothetical protein